MSTHRNLTLGFAQHRVRRRFLGAVADQSRAKDFGEIAYRHFALGAAGDSLQVENQEGQSVSVRLRELGYRLIKGRVRVLFVRDSRRPRKISPESDGDEWLAKSPA